MEEQFYTLYNAILTGDLDTFKREWSPERADSLSDSCGTTVLHEAVIWGNRTEFVRFALENGANPNIQTLYSKSTPFMFGWGNVDATRARTHVALLKHGANPFIRNMHHICAYSVAKQNNILTDYLDSFLLVDLVCGEADDLPKDIWRVVKPFIYNI